MTTTPLMGLTLPVEHGSADVWDTILDAVFGVIDSHDHTTGKGAQVPSAGLKIDADVSWSSAAVSHAITDLKAIDFAPQAASGMTLLSGALFLNSADNELYWRNTSGVLVKFTAGAALNVAAFTGGIGGDYSAAGALVVFDDATDSYWFQQQIGAGVRQYARMRSADVDLYEFKANPAAGVPTNRVRLASPAALAASYTLTMPAALPASKAALRVDSAGTVSVESLGTRTFPIGMALPGTGSFTVAGNAMWVTIGTGSSTVLPVPIHVGETITSWSAYVDKASNAAVTLTATMIVWTGAHLGGGGTVVGVAQTSSANAPGAFVMGQSGLSQVVAAGTFYGIILNVSAGTADVAYGYSVTS